MAVQTKVNIYLEDPLLQSAEMGEHNFVNLLAAVLGQAGLEVRYCPMAEKRTAEGTFSLTHMADPPNDNGLVFRRVYHYPFWQIEATAQRWQWDTAQAEFDPATVPQDAMRFYRFWQKRLFGDAAVTARREGFVYVPLQGKLRKERMFQSCSPLEMVEHCLAHEPKRKVIAALHPKENYETDDLEALNRLHARHPRLEIDLGNMERYLAGCDYVVTQNSSAAFSGYFFGKPALLFGLADFHHIAVKSDLDALEHCFETVRIAAPSFEKYIWWFWQHQSINAGRDDAKAKIAARLVRFDWPVVE